MVKSKSLSENSVQNNFPKRHLVEELEEQFHALQKQLEKTRETYLTYHKNEVRLAREKMQHIQGKLAKARKKVARAAVAAKNSTDNTTRNQSKLEKAQAASLVLADSLKEAREVMVTARSRLHIARSLDRRLAARTKVIAKFEKDWETKTHEEAAKKTAKAKKAAARRRTNAKKRAAEKLAGSKPPVTGDN